MEHEKFYVHVCTLRRTCLLAVHSFRCDTAAVALFDPTRSIRCPIISVLTVSVRKRSGEMLHAIAIQECRRTNVESPTWIVFTR
jgi:hypothetical protein